RVPIFPPSFTDENRLEKLDLSWNKLKGFLNFSQFKRLKELLLHKNMITWPHPWKNVFTCVLPSFLTKLTLAYNAFSDLLDLKGLKFYKYLRELTIVGNPCVGSLLVLDANGKQLGNIRETNFRPYILTCCPNLNLLDDKPVEDKDREKSLWLLRQEMFLPKPLPPTHGDLVLYLAENCPLDPQELDQNDRISDDDSVSEITEIYEEHVRNDRTINVVGDSDGEGDDDCGRTMNKSGSDVCRYYVELMEEKARQYKFEREVEFLLEEANGFVRKDTISSINFIINVYYND
ncbi:Centrosomal protein, partial [Armadillidium nasatum]